MGTTAVIGIGILVWVLMAIPLALFVARMIKLRDRQRPGRTEPRASAEGKPANGGEPVRMRRRWQSRNKT
jgi:hypothetical protein